MGFISKTKGNTLIPLVSLLIYLSIIPMQLSNYVLCIGPDGHVEFEIGINGHCTHTHDFHEDRTAAVISTAGLADSHCGPCIDFAIFVPLNMDTYLVPVQNPFTPAPALVATFVKYPTNNGTIPAYPLLQTASVVNPALISLRSTMLLI